MGGGGEKMPGQYMGWWGNLGSLPQKGVTSYGLSNNRQKPLGGAFHNAIFNTFRRTRQQILFWAPPMIAGYSIMQWAIENNEYYNGKEGRALMGDEE
ncbi:Cytochrome b-c1 complex subunit 8, mitochondrial [Diplodia seriata]|uniref:Cytochrome b-c1 complex subunit 8 n=2 Tax=Diplodia seriata TaxID=420778 RepID=A0A0G2E652_9PEZI|nr:putative ubiquinol-cytochrome c reductase subunit 8 [Diplodia seriata]